MKKFLFVFTALLILGGSSVLAHSGNPKYHVIVDTDGGADDMRALSMLLSGNDIRVLAITCSRGNLEAYAVYEKVRALSAVFHHEGIPSAAAEKLKTPLPPWSDFAREIDWGPKHEVQKNVSDASLLLTESLKNYKDTVSLIALGSLKTYADWLKAHPDLHGKIRRIIWYNSHAVESGFNYRLSPESFAYIKNTGIPLEIVENKSDNLIINRAYLDAVQKAPTRYAKQIVKVHEQPAVEQKIQEKHLHLWDDLLPLYLTVPLLFETKTENGLRLAEINPQLPPDFVYETISDILASTAKANNRVFENFPADTALYKPAYAKIMHQTIENYGLREWKAICLTNEIHGHTGIYSVIGAKMGIRAMEYFNVGVNNLKVTSFAGNRPPLSCFNDGLQISSGATIGQGLITVSDSISEIPSAVFSFNGRRIRISLKENLSKKMQEEIRYGIRNYGLLTDPYWAYIERLAADYWRDYDRHNIFIID